MIIVRPGADERPLRLFADGISAESIAFALSVIYSPTKNEVFQPG
jgi:hypothetical protein